MKNRVGPQAWKKNVIYANRQCRVGEFERNKRRSFVEFTAMPIYFIPPRVYARRISRTNVSFNLTPHREREPAYFIPIAA